MTDGVVEEGEEEDRARMRVSTVYRPSSQTRSITSYPWSLQRNAYNLLGHFEDRSVNRDLGNGSLDTRSEAVKENTVDRDACGKERTEERTDVPFPGCCTIH